MRYLRALLLLCLPLAAQTPCACDPADPESMKARQCSLCIEAEKQPADVEVFFLKDINPRKPNRWLALPRVHTDELHSLSSLPPQLRTRLWTAAIERAKQMWGKDWGVAYNSDRVRTQCHTHLHLGKLLPGVETEPVDVVASPAGIPVSDGDAMWIHEVDGKIHVHRGEYIAETVLLR